MSKYANIPHPLFNLPGSSQNKRLLPALDPETLEVDGRSLADILDFIYHFAGQVYHYDNNLELGDWRAFFAESLPFLIARIHKWDIQSLEENLLRLGRSVEQQPEPEALDSIFSFVYNELLTPVLLWQLRFEKEGFGLGLKVNNLIVANLQAPVKSYIALANGAQKWYCIKKQDFRMFQQQGSWGLELLDLFASDESFREVPGPARIRILAVNQALAPLAARFLEAIVEIKRLAPDYLQESLIPLEEEYKKSHAPHLGLLFTFLQLFRRFQLDLNKISTRHLEFFYNKVLGIQARRLTPDQAHLVFEIQKHLDNKLLSKGLLFKNGKDSQNNDIFFRLEEDIVVDKAQVESLQTLHLNYMEGCICQDDGNKKVRLLESAYIAPVANSRDGKGEAFKEEGSSWATMGNRESKYFLPGAPPPTEPELHPVARHGFVLASPVLLLQEGRRVVDISLKLKCKVLDCDLKLDLDEEGLKFLKSALEHSHYIITREAFEAIEQGTFTGQDPKRFLNERLRIADPYFIRDDFKIIRMRPQDCVVIEEDIQELSVGDDQDVIKEFFRSEKALLLSFSAEGEWWQPKPDDVQIELISTLPAGSDDDCENRDWELEIHVEIPPEAPPITFFDAEALQEPFQTRMPLVKIEINDIIRVETQLEDCEPDCSLERCLEGGRARTSLYHYLRHFCITDSCIEVEVCGVRNLLVQNEENLQDANGLIQPFGVRPKLQAEFYIGSKEIFCKNWKQFRIKATWKDKPDNFADYYNDYEDVAGPTDDSSFKFLPAVLAEGLWAYYDNSNDSGPITIFDNINVEDSPPYPPPPPPPIPPPPPPLPSLLCGLEWDDPESIPSSYSHEFDRIEFSGLPDYVPGQMTPELLQPLSNATRKGFIKLVLKGKDFLHDYYAFVLAKIMIDLAGGFNPVKIVEFKKDVDAAVAIRNVIKNKMDSLQFHLGRVIDEIETAIKDLNLAAPPGIIQRLNTLRSELDAIDALLPGDPNTANTDIGNILAAGGTLELIEDEVQDIHDNLQHTLAIHLQEMRDLLTIVVAPIDPPDPPNYNDRGIQQLLENLRIILNDIEEFADSNTGGDSLPNEPYTPTIKGLSIDYFAKSQNEDIQLIHLYPYEGTYKEEDITDAPSLLPTFVKEGHLFIGLKDYTPGNNVHLLFQLAESTADSESNAADIEWHYLRKNEWEPLQDGFHLLSDTTDGLTRSGIVKITIPEDINKDESNTIMPPGLHWIRACAWINTKAVAETIGVHTQAARVSYHPLPENARLEMMLKAGSISKLAEADSSLKGISQFYETFGGQLAESSNNFYKRVGERLRHKGRSVDKYDYERIVLDRFPEVFRVKCLNHSFSLSANQYRRDLELAPGFVSLALIPDITKLKAGAGFTPKVPVSLLNKIREYIRQKASPFVRLKVMNPRYERMHIAGEVILGQGIPKTFFQNKLREDLRRFLTPWVDGNMSQLDFGRVISKSEVIRFIESLVYVDYVCNLKLIHEEEEVACYGSTNPFKDPEVIVPLTARSILIGGEMRIEAKNWQCPEPRKECKEKAHKYKANCQEETGPAPEGFSVA
ncbi:MAG: hypothetical protein H6558_12220 [Lewinellaceae bacterium]|nr:hypothetical protein [Phaeodactylibacter sp.]MCB9265783.1 hypothetical protein [Lewinellaceae bacterium]MCB9352573.1 hypothetical protein [Lewinellaceae bacterium]